jgi:hypothetical protein
MPAGNVAVRRATVWRKGVSAWRRKFSILPRRQESKYFLQSCGGLIGEKQVAGVLEQDELRARNLAGDQLAVAGGYEAI